MGSDVYEFDEMHVLYGISIHAPRMGSDYSGDASLRIMLNFNPRSPDGERLSKSFAPPNVSRISIHAPRMGSDWTRERSSKWFVFQSTLPGWGATAKMDIFAHDMGKIIHFQH